jgi:copper(I)-binding protein
MTPGPGARAARLTTASLTLVLVVLVGGGALLGGCVYYPTVEDVGGVRLQPEHGRVVREGDGALFFVDINSTGMFEDALVRVETPIAKRTQLLAQTGEPLTRLLVPGTSLVRLHPGGDRVALSELTRELKVGEVVIVTLFFEKSGALGVVSSVE